ncbi:hypothetical protein VTN02DRAFT_5402 [Thermoascus thermophilus]
MAWLACQLGAFQLARRTDAYWLRETSPRPSPSWPVALWDLVRQLLSTWFYGENAYDQPQWALLPLFKASLYVFMTLLATVNTTPRFRLLAEAILYLWSWAIGDGLVGLNVFAGMILAELSVPHPPEPRSLLGRVLPYPLAVLGLYLCSFPDQYQQQAAWSRQLWQIGLVIFPQNASMGRFYAGLGAQILCASVLHSPSLRRALSHRALLWLGGVSFPLYLLHGPLMRSVMTYLLFGRAALSFTPATLEDGSPDPDSLIPVPGFATLCLLLPVFFAFLLVVVRWWSVRVEPSFGAATDRLESFAGSWGLSGGSLLPTAVARKQAL